MKQIITILFMLIFVTGFTYSQPGWVLQNSGTTNHLYSISFADVNTGVAVGYDGTVCRTTNGGINWSVTHIPSNYTYTFNSVWMSNPLQGFMAGSQAGISENDGLVFNTNDGGLTWTGNVWITGVGDLYFNSISFLNNTTGYVVGYEIDNITTTIDPVIMKTNNAGGSWVSLNAGFTTILKSVFIYDANTAYAVGTSGAVLKTTDGGSSWTNGASGYTVPFNSVFFPAQNTGYAVGDLGKVIKTTDAGATWSHISMGAPYSSYVLKSIYFFSNSDVGFVSAAYGLIRRTTDGGATWATQPSGTTNNINCITFIDSLNGFACGQNGLILRTTNAGLTFVNQISSEVPSGYKLDQNYPNPFNPTTKIKFGVPKSGEVHLVVYDAIGKEAATLVNEQLSPGNYEVEWNASNYPSGVYYYKIYGGSFSETKKMVLVK